MAALPLPAAVSDDLISGYPGMRSSKMAAGSGRAAIFHHHHNMVRKVLPMSCLTSFPVPPSWNQDGGATSSVLRMSELPWNPQKGVVLVQKHPVDLWSYIFLLFEKHLIVSLPSHSWNGWGSCPLATTGKLISLQVWTPCSMKRGVDFGKHLLYFFLDFMFLFFVCTLKYSRIIVEYSVIVGRSLDWLETNLNPTMTILLFSSILSTKRQWQSSTSTRPVWQRQKGVLDTE